MLFLEENRTFTHIYAYADVDYRIGAQPQGQGPKDILSGPVHPLLASHPVKGKLSQEGKENQALEIPLPAVGQAKPLCQEKGKYGKGQPPHAPKPQHTGKECYPYMVDEHGAGGDTAKSLPGGAGSHSSLHKAQSRGSAGTRLRASGIGALGLAPNLFL